MTEGNGKRTVWILLLVIALVTTGFIAGCSSPSQPSQTSPGQTTTAPGGAQTTTSATMTTPVPGSVKAVDFNTLIPFLPNAPAGWTAADPDGMTSQYQGGSWSMATREYTNAANESIGR